MNPGEDSTPDELRDFAKSKLAACKYPRIVWLLDQLPKGPTGKRTAVSVKTGQLRFRVGLGLASVALVASAGSASAADMVYWTNYTGNTISMANLDGSGGGRDLNTTGATVTTPEGVAVDPAHNRIYWANFLANKISMANLDGSGGGNDLNTTGATVNHPVGVSVDPAHKRIYWANNGGDTISMANLDGSGGGRDLKTTGATVKAPSGVAIDPAHNRIYWASTSGNTISMANLDGSGGGRDLNTTGATVLGPEGVVIDPAHNRIYWANPFSVTTISMANLDGSGGGRDLNTTGATASGPLGVAIDPARNRIYWANYGANKISMANLDGSGGGSDLNTAGATVGQPGFPALVQTPSAAGAPTIAGSRAVGSPLSCSQGVWNEDLLGALLFQAPRTFGYSWQLNGTDIAGARGQTLTASQPGSYTCRVSATNQAGSAAQSSLPLATAARTNPAFLVISKKASKRGVITLRVRTNAAGTLAATATYTKRTKHGHHRRATRKRARYGTATATAAYDVVTLTIRPTRGATKQLRWRKRLRALIRISLASSGEQANVASVTLRIKPHGRRAASSIPRR